MRLWRHTSSLRVQLGQMSSIQLCKDGAHPASHHAKRVDQHPPLPAAWHRSPSCICLISRNPTGSTWVERHCCRGQRMVGRTHYLSGVPASGWADRVCLARLGHRHADRLAALDSLARLSRAINQWRCVPAACQSNRTLPRSTLGQTGSRSDPRRATARQAIASIASLNSGCVVIRQVARICGQARGHLVAAAAQFDSISGCRRHRPHHPQPARAVAASPRTAPAWVSRANSSARGFAQALAGLQLTQAACPSSSNPCCTTCQWPNSATTKPHGMLGGIARRMEALPLVSVRDQAGSINALSCSRRAGTRGRVWRSFASRLSKRERFTPYWMKPPRAYTLPEIVQQWLRRATHAGVPASGSTPAAQPRDADEVSVGGRLRRSSSFFPHASGAGAGEPSASAGIELGRQADLRR